MSDPLSKYSTAALLEEIARRQRARDERKPIRNWCDDCKLFRFWTGKGDPPDRYNPCGKGHKMSFRMPDDYSDRFGYYRRICEDRQC